ncbi:hypothetical protein PDE_05842 [Penicillium oxalicum 114-2]|uniref:Uncharacterized protein n=1 Tax=Penicillium oxalicum (strain 114-2 / CGMCC 5302) TaxID=933388 RepID=S7ZKS6_PENO1|nr:hypothetical protein PDE_05842 [Penicillium oxalicum 114-2]
MGTLTNRVDGCTRVRRLSSSTPRDVSAHAVECSNPWTDPGNVQDKGSVNSEDERARSIYQYICASLLKIENIMTELIMRMRCLHCVVNQVMESFVDYRSPGKCDTIPEKKKKEQDLRSSKKTTQDSHRSMHIAAFPVPSLHSPQGDISSQTSGVESLAVQEVLLSAQSSARCRRVADVLYPPPLLLET